MSNAKLIQDLYAAFGRGDLNAVIDACAPDVTWGTVGRPKDVPFSGIRSGKEGVVEFFKALKQTQELKQFQPQRFLGAEDMVFVLGHTQWTMNNNGISGENDWVHIYTLKDGKIVKFRGHLDTGLLAEAYHAAPAARRAKVA